LKNDWGKDSINPEVLRDNLTDLLRVVDPGSQAIPRVMTRKAFEGQNNLSNHRNLVKNGNPHFSRNPSFMNNNLHPNSISRSPLRPS